MTIRHVRIETPMFGYNWADVVDLDDADPKVAAAITNGRMTVVAGTPATTAPISIPVIQSATLPDVTRLAGTVLWLQPSGVASLLTSGGVQTPISGGGAQLVAANTTLNVSSPDVTVADATAAARVVTLPAASAVPGRIYTVKKGDGSANAVTVTAAGTDKIDGAATYALAAANNAVRVLSDGASKWYVIAKV